MTTAPAIETWRDDLGTDDQVALRLPRLIDAWVRDGLISAQAAVRVFHPHVVMPDVDGLTPPRRRRTLTKDRP